MQVFNVIEFGAVADNQTVCTDAFAKAIDAAHAAGGGRVLVPPGEYVTGPIVFKSFVELRVERGAIIRFSRNYDHYPLVRTDYEGLPAVRCISPLWAEDLDDIAITGEGIIDGQGEAWRPVKKFKLTEQQWTDLVKSGGVTNDAGTMWYPTKAAMTGFEHIRKIEANGRQPDLSEYTPARDCLRPNMLKFSKCRGVRLEGPTFRNSACWNVHLLLCRGVVVRNVRIENPWYSSNGDGIDIDACHNVIVEHSHFDCGDDSICIKSGKDEPGRRRGVPCENITINNCVVLAGHGGVTIGSEMSGGVRNVRVTNCVFNGTDIGLRFKSTRGRGGVVENIEISNVAMHNIKLDAISLNLYYWVSGKPVQEPVSDRTPIFRGFTFRNITCDGAGRGIEIRGLPEMPISRILFENIRMNTKAGVTIVDASDVSLRDVQLNTETLPAVSCHNVRNLKLDSVDAFGPPEDLGEKRVGDL
jgi:polygalacturonase